MEEELTGCVEKVLFNNEENGYAVAKLEKRSRHDDSICIFGCMPGVQPGNFVSCKGLWKVHPKYGRQFSVSTFELEAPTTIKGIQRYLESGQIRGIGKITAEKIVDKFGFETLEILEREPERLYEIEGFGKKKVAKIIEDFKDQKEIRNVMVFLKEYGIGNQLAKKIYKKYGQKTVTVLKKTPYRLSQDIARVGFKTADKIAFELGIAKDAPERIQAGIDHVLRKLSEDGHTCHPEEKLIEIAKEHLEVEKEHIVQALLILESQKTIIRDALEDQPFVWLSTLFHSEKGITKELKRLKKGETHLRSVNSKKAAEWSEKHHKIEFAPEQRDAIVTSCEEKIHIITGGPGTGKSTITKAILSVYDKIKAKIVLCAPTGKAAKRMSEICRKKAFTIHCLLEFDVINGGFKKNREDPLKADLIIIDEVSMIDTYLLFALLKAVPDSAKVIFIGDVDQLPSVGPGNVLKDMIESEKIKSTRLKQIFRQKQRSNIVLSAHNVNNGLFPILTPPHLKSDLIFHDIQDGEKIAEKIADLVAEEIPSSHKFDPLKDIQVLSPMKRGIIGIENLNIHLQERLNPNKKQLIYFGRAFQEGDKVMQLKNNYQKKVFNGDIGFIEKISILDKLVTVKFDSHIVQYQMSELNELQLAYATSIHKYQGSEAPCIIIPMHTSHFMLLQRNLLYTGITRGKKLVILIGMKKAIALAIQNDKVQTRYSALKNFLVN